MKFVVIASPYHGYPHLGEHTDVKHNKWRADRIIKKFYETQLGVMPISLVLGCPTEDEEAAVAWCNHQVEIADEIHFWYPKGLGFSEGMKREFAIALKAKVPTEKHELEDW
jgi:hypothetical protein